MRIVAFCCVVSLHTVTPDGPLSTALNVLARFAVPFFFAVSGFFSVDVPVARLARRVRHAAALCVAGVVLYVVTARLGYTPTAASFAEAQGVGPLLKNFLIWNDYPPAYPLWFLFALLYVYAIYYVLMRVGASTSSVIGAGLALLAARFLLIEVDQVITPLGMQVRSWLLSGLPFFSLGLLLRREEERLAKLKVPVILALGIAGFALALAECKVVGLMEVYVGTIPLVVACFALCIRFPLSTWSTSPLIRLLRGGDVCLVAYLVHYAVISVGEHLAPAQFASGADGVKLALTCVISLGIGIVFAQLTRLVARLKPTSRRS